MMFYDILKVSWIMFFSVYLARMPNLITPPNFICFPIYVAVLIPWDPHTNFSSYLSR